MSSSHTAAGWWHATANAVLSEDLLCGWPTAIELTKEDMK